MGISAPAELKTKIISLNLSPSSGNINTFLDSAGDRVAGRGGDKHNPSSGQAGSEIAEKGMAEFRQGLANIKGGKKKDPDASTPSSTAPETKTGAPENQPSTAPSAGPPVAATADVAPKEGPPGPVQQEPPKTEAPTAAPVTDRVPTGDQKPMDQQSPVQSQPGSEGHAAPKETEIEPKTTDKPPTPESRISGEQSPMQKQPADDVGDKTASGAPPVTSGSHP